MWGGVGFGNTVNSVNCDGKIEKLSHLNKAGIKLLSSQFDFNVHIQSKLLYYTYITQSS